MQKSEAKVSSPNNTKSAVRSIKFPRNALNTTNMLFLITREFKQHKRYKTPFSAVIVSVKHVVQNGKSRVPQNEEIAELLPQLFTVVEPLLRSADLAGTMISTELFLALPMTDEVGARTVRVRILEQIDRNTFVLANQKVTLKVKITISIPAETTKDIKAFVKEAMIAHYS